MLNLAMVYDGPHSTAIDIDMNTEQSESESIIAKFHREGDNDA